MTLLRMGVALCVLLLSSPVSARTTIYEDEDVQLYYGGYIRDFLSWQHIDGAARELMATSGQEYGHVAMQSLIGRSEFKLSAADWFTAEVHSRYAWTMATEPVFDGAQMGAGAGISVVPRRTLDLQTTLISEPNHRLEFDIDRALLRFYLGDVDISVGRQAVTWGNSLLFGVSDVWTTFSPFDLDTSQKRGIDALRMVWAVTDWAELDVIVADRGSVEDLSGGVRAQFYLNFGEVFVAAAKSYEDLALAAGLSADVDTVKLRGEVMARFDLDKGELELPRATVGMDWFYSDSFMGGVELHFNGFGTDDTSDMGYLAHAAQEPALTRGEGYLLGQLYAGTFLSYRPHELITLSGSALMNLLDPSALISWSLGWEVLQSVDLSVGGYHGAGEGLEFGLSGHLGYLQVSAYF